MTARRSRPRTHSLIAALDCIRRHHDAFPLNFILFSLHTLQPWKGASSRSCSGEDPTCLHHVRMASSFAQGPQDLMRLLNRVRIPHDQEKLLAQNNAWSDVLNSGPHPMLNVPNQVLEDVKNFHVRQRAKNLSSRQSPTAAAATVVSSPPPGSNNDARNNRQTTPSTWPASGMPEDADDSDEADEAGGSAREAVENGGLEIEAMPPASRSNPPEHEHASTSHFPAALPTSSMAQSEDLEFQAPEYLSQQIDAPVNREALPTIASTRPEPTPPSAQIPVASTKQAVPSRRRTSGVPDAGHGDAAKKAGSSGLSTAAKPAESKTKSSSNLTATWEGRQESPYPLVSSTTFPVPAYGNAPPYAQPVQQSNSNTPTPYEMFKAAYPDYPDIARNFIAACLNLKQLMRDQALAEFLYDDFVRAFSTFLMYISECGRRGIGQILPAWRWYNETTKDPEYLKKIIRKDNLDAILEAHADEVRTVKSALPVPPSPESSSVVEDSDEEMQDIPAQGDQEGVGVEDLGLEDAHQFRPSPEFHHTESPILTANQKPPDLGHGESPTERHKAQAEALPRQATIPRSSPMSRLKTPSAKVVDARSSRAGNSGPMVPNTPTPRKSLHPSDRSVTSYSSGGSIYTISPVPRLRPHPSSPRPQDGQEHRQPASRSASKDLGEKQKQKAPMLVPATPKTTHNVPSSSSSLSKKRPRSVEGEDDDAFDSPVRDPMPPPPKKLARSASNQPGMSQPRFSQPAMSTPPLAAAQRPYASTMPAASAAVVGSKMRSTASGLGPATGRAASDQSRPEAKNIASNKAASGSGDRRHSASAASADKARSKSHAGTKSYVTNKEGTSDMSAEDRTRLFKKHQLKKRRSEAAAAASSSSAAPRKE